MDRVIFKDASTANKTIVIPKINTMDGFVPKKPCDEERAERKDY